MFNHRKPKPTPADKNPIKDAINLLNKEAKELAALEDYWKPSEQGVIDPITRQELPLTYGMLGQAIHNNSCRLSILEKMQNSEAITSQEHLLLLEVLKLQTVAEIKDYPHIEVKPLSPTFK